MRQNNKIIANFYQGYTDDDFEHDMDYESIIGDDFEYQYENTDFEFHGYDEPDYDVPGDIIQDSHQRMEQNSLVNQNDSQTMSSNDVIDILSLNWEDRYVSKDLVPHLDDRFFNDFYDALSVCSSTLCAEHKDNPSGSVLTCVTNSTKDDLMVMNCPTYLMDQQHIPRLDTTLTKPCTGVIQDRRQEAMRHNNENIANFYRGYTEDDFEHDLDYESIIGDDFEYQYEITDFEFHDYDELDYEVPYDMIQDLQQGMEQDDLVSQNDSQTISLNNMIDITFSNWEDKYVLKHLVPHLVDRLFEDFYHMNSMINDLMVMSCPTYLIDLQKLRPKDNTTLTNDLINKQYDEILEDACLEIVLWDEPFYDGVRSVIQKTKTICPDIDIMPGSCCHARPSLESAKTTTGHAPFDSSRESTDRNKVPFGPSDVEVLRLEGKIKPARTMNQLQLKQAAVRLLDKQNIDKAQWLSASQKHAFWRKHNATIDKHLDTYFGKNVSAYVSIPSDNRVTGNIYDEFGTAAIVRQYVLGRQLFIDKQQHVVILISPAQEEDVMKDSAMTSYETKDYGPLYYREYNGTNPDYQGKLFLLGTSQQNYFKENPLSACNKYNDILQILKLPACIVKGMVTITTIAKFQPFELVSTPITKAIGQNMISIHGMFALMAMYTTSEPTVVWMNPKHYQELQDNSMWRVIDCVKPSGEATKVHVRKYTGCRPWHNYTFALNDSLCTLDRIPSREDVCAAYNCIYPTEEENGLAVLNPPGEQGSKAEFLKSHLDGFSYAVTQKGKMIGWDFTECNQLQMFLAYHQKEIIATFRKPAENGESQMMQAEETEEFLMDSDSDFSIDNSDPEEFERIYRQMCIDKALTHEYHDDCNFCKNLQEGKLDYLSVEIQALYRNVHFNVDPMYRDEDTDWIDWFCWLTDLCDDEEHRIRHEDREANMTMPVKRLIRSILQDDIQTVQDHGLPDDAIPSHAKSFGNPELLEKRGVLWRVPYDLMIDLDNAQFDTDFFHYQIELARDIKASTDKRQPAVNGTSQAGMAMPMALGMGGGMLQGLGSGMEATSNALFSMQMQERTQKFQKQLFDQQLGQGMEIANMRNDTARWTVQQQLQNQLELANINFRNTHVLNLEQNQFQKQLSAQNFEQNSDLSFQQYKQSSQLQDQNWMNALQYQADLLDLRGISTTQGQVNMGRAESRTGLGASSTGLWQAAGRGDTLQDALNNYRMTGIPNSQSGQLHTMVFTNSQLQQNAAGGSFLPSSASIHAAGTPDATIVADQAAHGAGHEIQSSDVTGPTPSTRLDVVAKTPSSSSPVYDESISLGRRGELARGLNEGSAKILPIAPAAMNAPSVEPPTTTYA